MFVPVRATVGTRSAQYAPGEVIVKLKDAAAPDSSSVNRDEQLMRAARSLSPREGIVRTVEPLLRAPGGRGAQIAAARGLDRIFLLKFDPSADVGSLVAELLSDPAVEYAEPNILIEPAALVPNDPDFYEQWALRNQGVGVIGYPSSLDADIKATQAWDITTGSPNVLIALTDTGADITHPDLAPNIYTNPGEIPNNGIDDDNNGYTDDVNGVGIPEQNGDAGDVTGHGTEMAGIIAARLNNAVGISGVSQSKILPVRFFKQTGPEPYEFEATAIDAARALIYSISAGASIINASWSARLQADIVPPEWAQALKDAVTATYDAGVLLVCVAGNEGYNLDYSRIYPASYQLPNQIVVAVSDFNDEIFHSYYDQSVKTGFGPSTVHLAAPGVAVFTIRARGNCIDCTASPDPADWYTREFRVDGTSASAAFVSGVAALVKSAYPEANFIVMRRRILEGVDVIPALKPYVVTSGRLSALGALNVRLQLSQPIVTRIKVKGGGKKVFVYGSGIHKDARVFVGRISYPIKPKAEDLSAVLVKVPAGTFPPGTPVEVTLINPDGGSSEPRTIVR